MNNINRRTLLKYAGTGLAASVFSTSVGKTMTSALAGIDETAHRHGFTGKVPFSLIIDDGAPVDPLFYELPGYETPFLVPIVTHWQSLYTQGTELGLQGLATLAERIQKVFGTSYEWVTCSELAKRYLDSNG